MGKQKLQTSSKTDSIPSGNRISDYKIGDVNKKGLKIDRIYSSGDHFIIYGTENNRICFETHNLPPRLQPSVNEYKRLTADVATYFKGNYSQEITTLLVAALTSSLQSKEGEESIAYFKVARDFIKEKGKVKTVYGYSPEFIVWQDNKHNLNWSYLNLPDSLQKMVVEFEELKGLVQTTLPRSHYNQINSLVGFSLVAAFRAPTKKSMLEYFDSIKAFIEKRSDAYARARFLIYGLSSSLGMSILLLIIYYALSIYAETAGNIVLGAIGGILGASVSMVHRNKSIVVDPFVPPLNLIFLGAVRVFLGMVFGGIVIVMSKANLILGLLSGNIHSLFVVSVISGFAERFVPDVLEKLTVDKSVLRMTKKL